MSTNDTDFNDEGKLEYESPLLTRLKQSPIDFKEPEGYFEEFNRKLNERIKHEQPDITPSTKQGLVRRLFQPQYAIAAALITAICIIGFKFIGEWKPLKQPEIAEVIAAEKINSMDEEILIEAINEEVIDESDMVTEQEITNDVIVEYLLENDVDLDLINEL